MKNSQKLESIKIGRNRAELLGSKKIILLLSYVYAVLFLLFISGIAYVYSVISHWLYVKEHGELGITTYNFMKDVLGLSFGVGVPLMFIVFPFLWFQMKKAKRQAAIQFEETEKEILDGIEKERAELLKRQEQEEWKKQIDREIEREVRLAEVRHESTLKAMQSQIKLYAEYKEKGLDIEKQIFEMRKNLIELEGEENKNMLNEVRQALDDLDK